VSSARSRLIWRARKIDELVDLPGVDTVYNLEVEGYHTYFAEGLLVHNAVMKF
jgi:intein/homing endonuclease